VVVGQLFDESFVQGLLLLLATAGLTGLLVPLIKGRIDDRKLREQKVFESELARQGKVIDAQAQLLDDLSQQLWAFLLASLEVTYYAVQNNEEKFANAWKSYDEHSWKYFGSIRATISRARRLTSPQTHDAFLAVYDKWFMDFDLQLSNLARAGTSRPDAWSALHARIYDEGVPLIDGALADLARELKLEGGDVHAQP
jgi:hypothetical protein